MYSCVKINACVKIDECVEINAYAKINVCGTFLMKLTHALILTRALKLTHALKLMYALKLTRALKLTHAWKLTHAFKLTRAFKLRYELGKTFRLILYHQNSCVNFKRYNPNRFEISLKIICWHVLTIFKRWNRFQNNSSFRPSSTNQCLSPLKASRCPNSPSRDLEPCKRALMPLESTRFCHIGKQQTYN